LIWYGTADYCHVPTVDYRTLVVDAKISDQWRTLLIGTMGFGGKALGSYSSSIFVLDITNPTNPFFTVGKGFVRPKSDTFIPSSCKGRK